jgi:hypothetical protein
MCPDGVSASGEPVAACDGGVGGGESPLATGLDGPEEGEVGLAATASRWGVVGGPASGAGQGHGGSSESLLDFPEGTL